MDWISLVYGSGKWEVLVNEVVSLRVVNSAVILSSCYKTRGLPSSAQLHRISSFSIPFECIYPYVRIPDSAVGKRLARNMVSFLAILKSVIQSDLQETNELETYSSSGLESHISSK